MSRLIPMERAECFELLARGNFGRLAVNVGNQAPAIRPINYMFDKRSDSVVFRSAYGSKFHGLVMSAMAAFEIDGVDETSRTGWSVIVTGVCDVVTSQIERRRLEALVPEPWAPGLKPHWIKLHAATISGRRILVEEESVVSRNIATD